MPWSMSSPRSRTRSIRGTSIRCSTERTASGPRGWIDLLAASRAAGVRRFVAQSFAMWANTRTGGPMKSEEDPVETDPPPSVRETLATILYLEHAVVGATDLDGIALRYGMFYGPGTSIALDGSVIDMVRHRRFPLVGRANGVWSFIHVDDAASATLAAVERGAPGVYNVNDDIPASVATWLPVLAAAVGAPPPRRVPVWLARLLTGSAGVAMMTEVRGSSNAKAKRELGWQPTYASWEQGFHEGLA